MIQASNPIINNSACAIRTTLHFNFSWALHYKDHKPIVKLNGKVRGHVQRVALLPATHVMPSLSADKNEHTHRSQVREEQYFSSHVYYIQIFPLMKHFGYKP